MLVRTMRNASLGFDRARYVERMRRSDLAGAAAASCDSVEDASGGSGASTSASDGAAAFKRFRRRCGGSSIAEGSMRCAVVDDVVCDALFIPPPADETRDSILDSSSFREWNAFAQKKLLSTSSSLAAAICLVRIALENVRRLGSARRASRLAHRTQTVLLSIEAVRAAGDKRKSIDARRRKWVHCFNVLDIPRRLAAGNS